ncbi:hypothetical protein [Chryseobacterium aurantiacum]|uniref:hypothetical protein n=1 Tax=Chryseobacterium aurantiacum TaxID=2116499 RepID=UPI000D116F2F|nr:hypothetical protein [Chryseobacterium aurantiacum]
MTAQELETDYIERIHSNFIGQKIEQVFYEEINYETELEYWNFAENIHSVDMNVIFKMENGKLFQIKWDSEFYSYGIGFEEIGELKIKEGFKTINVTENENWKSKILKNISSITIYWDEAEIQQYREMTNSLVSKNIKKTIRIPLTWEINVDKEKVYISAFEINEDGNNNYWTDHLTIHFNEQELKKHKL